MLGFGKGCMAGIGGGACLSSSVAANHRQVAIAHPLFDLDNTGVDDKYKHDNNNSAHIDPTEPHYALDLMDPKPDLKYPLINCLHKLSAPTSQQRRP